MIQLVFSIIALCFVFLQCTGERIAGGSETTNGIIVSVVRNTLLITGPAGSNVEFYLANYLPASNTGPFASIGLNDSGSASLDSIVSGNYNLLFQTPSDSMLAIIQSVYIPQKVNKSWYGNLEFPGSLSGNLVISNASTTDGYAVLYLIGTPFIGKFSLDDSITHYSFKRIPPGQYICQYEIKNIDPKGVILGVRQGTLQTVVIRSNQDVIIQEPSRIP